MNVNPHDCNARQSTHDSDNARLSHQVTAQHSTAQDTTVTHDTTPQDMTTQNTTLKRDSRITRLYTTAQRTTAQHTTVTHDGHTTHALALRWLNFKHPPIG